ncbi:MAG: hypothetical protein N4A72_12335 [Bacteroidales bacterium]|jgi:uncharacterized phage infection (PIP) family protein YhgE|nr:hypothetical protein [Bacteroidales bacterium]
MKNIFKIIILSVAVLSFASCKDKMSAEKDVNACVSKLKQFNTKFEEFNKDGVISKEGNKSEFSKLKSIAASYYESVNQINSNIETEKEDIAEGKEGYNYESDYQRIIKERNDEINSLVIQFKSNIEAMK